jgi:hypothetical protein
MILLIDADSLIYASCLKAKQENSSEKFYSDIEDSIAKFDEQYMKIVNDLEEIYEIDKIITFNGCKGNFRKLITPVYKANRKSQEIPPLLESMHNFVKEQYNSLWAYGIETDDLVAKYWFNISNDIGRNNVMIVSIDKDYKQFPALIYNYHFKRKEIYDISEEQAIYNFYEQFIIGDAADNIQYFKGKGAKFFEKNFKDCKTKYQYTKKMYALFKEKYKGKAKQKYIECYNLLKLRTY